METVVQHGGRVVILRPQGYLTGAAETDALESAIALALAKPGVQALIIDCLELVHFNSVGINILLNAELACHQPLKGQPYRGFRLARPDPRISSILRMTKFGLLLKAEPSVEAAVEAALSERS